MSTIIVEDANAAQVLLEKPLPPGRAGAASSKPVVLSTEDLAALNAVATALAATLAVSAASLPLPAGAATSAAQGTGNTSLAAILAQSVSVGGYTAMTAGTAVTAGRGVYINASAAGYVTLTAADASTRRAYCAVGSNFFPDAVTTFSLPGSGAATVDSAYVAK